jgi:hypothetical protein
MPVILATRKAEIGRIKASLGKKVNKTSSQPIKLGEMVHTCLPSYVGSINRRILAQASQRQYSKRTGVCLKQ